MHDRYKVLTLLLTLYVVESGYLPSMTTSFLCKDPTLSHPFKGDTVSITILLTSVYFGPILIITLTEILNKQTWKNVWRYYKQFLIGITLTLVLTDFIKTIVNEPRPHFLYSCEPDSNKVCQGGELIFDYNCTSNLTYRTINDLTRSFPSGHTSLSTFTALYLTYVIQTRLRPNPSRPIIKPLLICLCLMWSLICSLSRITDNRHHWWDVLGGAILGTCGACYTVSMMLRNTEVLKN